MEQLNASLEEDGGFATLHQAAHQDYLSRRSEVGAATGTGEVPEVAGISAGGLPNRVKCLHALVGHALVAGPGVNPAGDAALEEMKLRGLIPAGFRAASAQELAEGAGNDD